MQKNIDKDIPFIRKPTPQVGSTQQEAREASAQKSALEIELASPFDHLNYSTEYSWQQCLGQKIHQQPAWRSHVEAPKALQ